MTSDSATEEIPTYEELPRRDIVMDWAAYKRLSPNDKESFLELVSAIEKSGWLHPDRYAPPDWAVIDLDQYADYDEFVRELKKAGSGFYEGRKAEKRGFYTKFFDSRTFPVDMLSIDRSMTVRQGRPTAGALLKSIEQRGGYPTRFYDANIPDQGVYWLRRFGTFRSLPGHRQGDLVVNEQLVSYMSVVCFANLANYNLFIGHRDFLRDGVVYKMQLDFVKSILVSRNNFQLFGSTVDDSLSGLRYIGYGSFIGTNPGLRRWKKSNLFKPALFRFDYSAALEH